MDRVPFENDFRGVLLLDGPPDSSCFRVLLNVIAYFEVAFHWCLRTKLLTISSLLETVFSRIDCFHCERSLVKTVSKTPKASQLREDVSAAIARTTVVEHRQNGTKRARR